VIVPLFALSNAGVPLDGAFLATALVSPITLGIAIGYVVGKPFAIIVVTRLLTVLSRGRLRPPVGWASVVGTGTIAGVGFTVSVLIAGLAFHGRELAEAKIGILAAVVVSSLVTWLWYRLIALLPQRVRLRALLGHTTTLIDLRDPVDEDRDHIRGPADAIVTVVEYGDFECPYCGKAEPSVRALASEHQVPIRFVWRHLPIGEIHPHAELAAEAAEAAGAQGRFWEMHDLLLDSQHALEETDLARYAHDLDLDLDRFADDLASRRFRAHVADDVRSADSSSVSGTPTFFINGRRHYGAFDIDTLRAAVVAAHQSTLT
jgi:glutaredoxin